MTSKQQTRLELGEGVHDLSTKLVLFTALLFSAMASLWTHLTLNQYFFEPRFFMAWGLIHSLGFVVLYKPRLFGVGLVGTFVALQLYFYVALQDLRLPFVPISSVFFVVTSVALTSFLERKIPYLVSFWLAAWFCAGLWLYRSLPEENLPLLLRAMGVGFLFNALFFSALILAFNRVSRKVDAMIALLGPRHDYDEKRLHAAKLQILGELSASIAHEINNPLAAINGYSHQIKGELEENKTAPDWNLLKVCNERIKFNVDRIIEISRAMRGFARRDGEGEKSPVSLKELIDDSALLVRHHLNSAKVTLSVLMPDESTLVYGNRVQLSQLLVNLLSNARDACEGRSTRRVTVGFEKLGDNEIVLFVEDTGSGVPAELREDIFKPFFTTKDINKGTGLGLYISSMIAEKHGTQIRLSSPVDEKGEALGTRFELHLKPVRDRRSQAA